MVASPRGRLWDVLQHRAVLGGYKCHQKGFPARGGHAEVAGWSPRITLALTFGSMLGAARRRGPVQLAAEGSSVIRMDQLVHALVDEI